MPTKRDHAAKKATNLTEPFGSMKVTDPPKLDTVIEKEPESTITAKIVPNEIQNEEDIALDSAIFGSEAGNDVDCRGGGGAGQGLRGVINQALGLGGAQGANLNQQAQNQLMDDNDWDNDGPADDLDNN